MNSAKSTNLVNVKIMGAKNSVDMEAEADTGANISVFIGEELQNIDWMDLEDTNVHIKGFDGTATSFLGKAVMKLQLGNKIHQEEIFFSSTTTSNFLSRDACMALGIIPKGFPHEQLHSVKSIQQKDAKRENGQIPPQMCSNVRFVHSKIQSTDDIKDVAQSKYGMEMDDSRLLKLVGEFSEVFDKDKLPPMNTEPMIIKLKDNYVAKAITVPRKVPCARRDQEIEQIRKLEEDGIIGPIGDRPTEFCGPTICPIKPDDTLRFTTDFIHLNKQVLRTVHPTLSSWDVIHHIDLKAKYFSTFDCRKGYWQVLLAKESKDLTTFICSLGKFRY